MTRPKRSTPEERTEVERVIREFRDAHPHRPWPPDPRDDDASQLVRNPCGDPQCTTCYSTVDEADHVRRTGLPSA